MALNKLTCLSRASFHFIRGITTLSIKQQQISFQEDPPAEKTPSVNISTIYKESLEDPDFFNISELVRMDDLFNARVHLGHKRGTLNKNMSPFIFGSRFNHLIFDLDQTLPMLIKALNVTAHVAFREGIILFISRGPQYQLLVEKTAEDVGEYAHTRHWNNGTLTNSTKYYRCVTRLPDLFIFINTLNDVLAQHPAVVDCAKMLIPSIGIVDSNCDPRLITYPVPGNDDSFSAAKLYCKLFKEAINRGKNKRKLLIGKSA